MLVYYYGWKLYKHTSIQNAILFGIVGAVATNMKIVGMLIWAAIGLYIFISKIIEKLLDKLLVLKAISSVFVFFHYNNTCSMGQCIRFYGVFV